VATPIFKPMQLIRIGRAAILSIVVYDIKMDTFTRGVGVEMI